MVQLNFANAALGYHLGCRIVVLTRDSSLLD